MSEWISVEERMPIRCIKLSNGLMSFVDDADYEYLNTFSWQAHRRRDGKGWYAVNSHGERLHRLLMHPSGSQIVDHIDGDGLNNVRSNLRIGTQSQNCVNRKQTPGKYLRGARPKKDMWQGYIKYNGAQKSLGYFKTEQEAHIAYIKAAKKLHGDWMPLPEPPGEGE